MADMSGILTTFGGHSFDNFVVFPLKFVHSVSYTSGQPLRSDVFSYQCVSNAKCRLHATYKSHYWLS